MRTDWMPGRRGGVIAMAKAWIEVLKAKGAQWGIANAEISELEDLAGEVQVRLAEQQAGPGDRVLVARAREALDRLKARMRFMHSRRFFSPPMTDADWISLLLKPRDTTRTDHIVVPEVVEFELRLRNIREIVVNFWVKGSENRAKPMGYEGAVVVWNVLDEPPGSPEALKEHAMASRTPHIIEFHELQRGGTVYIALRWQNGRGLTGAWSEIQSAVIP